MQTNLSATTGNVWIDCEEHENINENTDNVSIETADLLMNALSNLTFDDEGFATETSDAQLQVEDSILGLLREHSCNPNPVLLRSKHIDYIQHAFAGLKCGWVSLDASKPWLIMWMMHTLDLLGTEIPLTIKIRAVSSLAACQHPDGGYGGGPGQIPHLATTYAAVNALAIIGTEDAFQSINRWKLYNFLEQMKQENGSYRMHNGGEIDVRGTYCAVNTAKLLHILTDKLMDRASEFIVQCQSYEGGMGAVPGIEAHGGYSYCAVAAMEIMGKMNMLDMDALTQWVCSRQMALEGGFSGRANKLVDGCYSLWQGGIVSLIEMHLKRKTGQQVNLLNRDALERYIVVCCQGGRGGLRDKPRKPVDYYHTCYCLSGLSVAQHIYTEHNGQVTAVPRSPIFGSSTNLVNPTHPAYNICINRAKNIIDYFSKIDMTESRS
ncbi:CAAX farnesyltransferase (FTase) subunit beta [Batrachochytrium dendrobatidis]|nr:CAAX farnesyltransferase (FTase) subunit beta [Batrachochytrium dendrobatidis]KAK5672431.1 CAAX farnesyltransferase (FTase) subunit beta [Batrachochytrium dendrobatidis]